MKDRPTHPAAHDQPEMTTKTFSRKFDSFFLFLFHLVWLRLNKTNGIVHIFNSKVPVHNVSISSIQYKTVSFFGECVSTCDGWFDARVPTLDQNIEHQRSRMANGSGGGDNNNKRAQK